VIVALTQKHTLYLTLAFLHIYLISQNNKWKILWVMGAGLDKEFVPPAIESLEGFSAVHVIY
jgi:hypothetical protein